MDKTSKNQSETADTTEQFFSIEELRLKRKTPSSIFSGICAAFGWKVGKMVTEKEYDKAVTSFSDNPIGKKVK
jgi:hypothetical protein